MTKKNTTDIDTMIEETQAEDAAMLEPPEGATQRGPERNGIMPISRPYKIKLPTGQTLKGTVDLYYAIVDGVPFEAQTKSEVIAALRAVGSSERIVAKLDRARRLVRDANKLAGGYGARLAEIADLIDEAIQTLS